MVFKNLREGTSARKMDKDHLIVAGKPFSIYNPYFEWEAESEK